VCRDANRQPIALPRRMLQLLQCIFLEHIAKSKKSVLELTCMVEYCDNLMCGKYTASEEDRSGRVGSYCFTCEKHKCNQCFFEDAFVGCQDRGIVLCRENSRLCHWDCDTCDVPYCLDFFEGHAARICDSCKPPTKYQDCVSMLYECSQCGDRPSEYDDTCRQEEIVANMASSDEETIETARARLTAEAKTQLDEGR
jgi:hypothetical protein